VTAAAAAQQTAPTQQTVTQTNIPEWAKPYAEKTLGQAQALTDINQNPFQQYGGQRVAGLNALQQQAGNNIAGMDIAGQTLAGSNMAVGAGLGSMNAGSNYAAQATNPGSVSQYMSPYMQNAVDWQKQQAVSDYGRALPGIGAQASNAGAFGGSRHAIVEAEAQRNLQNQLQGIQATGTQNAFQQANQNQQFGANLGLQGLNQANQSAANLGNLGQSQYGQQMGINSAQQTAGLQQQGIEQQNLSNQYQDFLNQQKYPYQQLGFMSDVLRGMPLTGTSNTSMYQAPPSSASQLGGVAQMGLGALMYGQKA
jgi:hypothetical protein